MDAEFNIPQSVQTGDSLGTHYLLGYVERDCTENWIGKSLKIDLHLRLHMQEALFREAKVTVALQIKESCVFQDL